ncbi:preprotein translocase subunit YajC [bacterium]|nr:MAG: preprotein translocase subunit YajC [bacterium]
MNYLIAMCGQQPQGTGETGQTGGIVGLLPIILIFVVFIIFFILPQTKRQKEHQKMLESLQKGDRVITSGGIIGVITDTKEDGSILVIKTGDAKVEVRRENITGKLTER